VNDRRDHRDDRRTDLRDRMDRNQRDWNERRDDLTDRRDDRRDDYSDRRDDRWDNRDNVREDWQDWADHRWHDHDYWHHGCWGGHYDSWWNHMWDEHPIAAGFGITAWGVNRLNYWFGYSTYYNPYYYEPYPVSSSVTIDYSQPLVVYEQEQYAEPATTAAAPTTATTAAAPPDAGSTDPGMTAFEQGREAFIAGNYDAALTGINAALATRPDDAALHEFRALIMFATGKYRDAAATLNAVLAVGPGWDWTTLSGLYADIDTYTKQLRALEDYIKQNPDAADARFVLAYHYLTAGHSAEAATQLQKVVAANPKDQVATQLLQMLTGPEGLPGTSPEPPPAPEAGTEGPSIPAADLAGTWAAKGPNNAQFQLQLTAEGDFTWTYTGDGKETKVEGVFVLEGTDLVLQPDVGGVMLATISPPRNGTFHFQGLGGGDDDKGLDFRKSG
jgi:tetratricopeptide (TPR) repeat protein